MKISVIITTRNRRDSLSRTLAVVKSLKPQPYEILVTVDGSSDGTVEEILQKYPDVILNVNSFNCGSIVSRHSMMLLARGDLVLALDDDSYPEQRDCLATLSSIFQEHADLAVATFPQRTDEYPETLSKRDFGRECDVRSFANSGACLSVAAYRSLEGFQKNFFHMYEEPDYALQCVAANWKVSYFPYITIRHHWVANSRSELRNHHLHARNEFWSTLMRCPMPYMFAVLLVRIFSQAYFAFKRGPIWLMREPTWWWQAMLGLPKVLKTRKPLDWNAYCRWLSLSGKRI